MKITIDVGLDDLLKKVNDYDWDTDTYNNSHYELKDSSVLEKDIREKLVNEVYHNIKYHTDWFKDMVNEVLTYNKREIVDEVIKEVSKKIINQKAIKDFKKSLED